MQLTHTFIDVNACLQAKQPVHDVIARKISEKWLVATSPIQPGQPIQWSPCQKEQHVLVPLVPYRIASEPASALAFMFSLGVIAAVDFNKVKRLHMAIGIPVGDGSDDEQQRLQYWFGFGIIV